MENSSSSSLVVCPPSACSEAVVPPLDAATVALSEIAESAREGLLALAVATGLQVMGAWMNADVEALCGPRGKHNADRTGYRHGVEAGSVTLGGRQVPVTRPRVRAADGSGELPLPAYECHEDGGLPPASPRITLAVKAGRCDGRRPGPHVARWVGSEQDSLGCACHERDGRAGAGDVCGAGRRRAGLAGVPGR